MFEEDWDAIIGEISNKVDGLIDNGQIDESASEQCMSTDTYLDMTDIETPSSPWNTSIKSWPTVTFGTVTPVATEDFHSDYQPRSVTEPTRCFICKYPRILSIAYGDTWPLPREFTSYCLL
jgi:hypothetical protein